MAGSSPIGANSPTVCITNDPQSNPQTARLISFARILGQDDQNRSTSQVMTMVATSAFTVVQSDPSGASVERVIRVGDEFQIYACDLLRYAGRGRVKPTP